MKKKPNSGLYVVNNMNMKKNNPNPSKNITKTGTQLQQIVTLIKKKLEQLLSRRIQKNQG